MAHAGVKVRARPRGGDRPFTTEQPGEALLRLADGFLLLGSGGRIKLRSAGADVVFGSSHAGTR